MNRMKRRFCGGAGPGAFGMAVAALALAACGGKTIAEKPAPAPASPVSPERPAEKSPHAVLETSKGRIVVKLLPEAAPKTVANFIELASGKKGWTDPKTGQGTNRPLYNGVIFHRVIPDFMIQTGDPLGNGTGGPGYRFEDEFSPSHPLDRAGVVAMANSGPGTNGSQFFITVAPTPWLTNRHSVFGEVVEGQEVAVSISKAPRSSDGRDAPLEPIVLQEVRIEYR